MISNKILVPVASGVSGLVLGWFGRGMCDGSGLSVVRPPTKEEALAKIDADVQKITAKKEKAVAKIDEQIKASAALREEIAKA